MSDVHADKNRRRYSASGAWGALAGLVASLMAWHRLDVSFAGAAIALYVAIPLVLLALTVAIPRIPYRSGIPLYVAALFGFMTFCYGVFLLVLRQHVV
jgi:hypothetical protein